VLDRLPGRPRPHDCAGSNRGWCRTTPPHRVALRAVPNGLICTRCGNCGRPRRELNIRQGRVPRRNEHREGLRSVTSTGRPDGCPGRSPQRFSSLKGRGRVNGGFAGVLAGVRACVTGVCCFPIAAMSVASGWPGQGPGGARPPAAAPQASLRRPAGSPMMGRRETGAGGGAGYSVLRSGPSRGQVWCGQCRWLLSSLRVSPAGAGAAWGGSASEERSGGVNQDGARAAGGRRGREPGDLAPGRWPGKAVHAARAGCGPAGGWARHRISPSRMP
jgi:hypothetical protein